MEKFIADEFKKWLENAVEDNLNEELELLKDNEEKIIDSFYQDLSFGTAGLRGVIGAGTNRMNVYTVKKTSQGLANFINKKFKNGSIAISYDSRIKSDLFSKTAAEVFAGNGIKVYIYKELMPTPLLSYAVRTLKCSNGIMVTASHNPSKYNGYKVYGSDGCQITSDDADSITQEIKNVDCFSDIKTINFDDGIKNNLIEIINDSVYDSFIERVKKESVLGDLNVDKNIKIVYSPLNGTGLKPVTRILKESGFNNVIVVKEQELPDGNFPTCPYPNPEIKEAMALGIQYAKDNDADILIATDPDCDRVGIAVKDKEGNLQLMTGNQVGVLLLDFICKMRIKNNTMPKNPVGVKTIVTTDMVLDVANKYGVKIFNVLTGFKYIGDVIAKLEKNSAESNYILGFEESYGYLTGSYVRDKDAVDGVFLIAEMFAYYKSLGKSLLDVLNELYDEFGYFLNKVNTYEFEGISGGKKMDNLMCSLREEIKHLGDFEVVNKIDYLSGIDGLPKANVIKFSLNNGSSVLVRPSGTEPKLKIYYSIKASCEEQANKAYQNLSQFFNVFVK